MSFSLSLYLAGQTRRTADLRAQLESEDTPASAEEMGRASMERPDGILAWFHAPNTKKALALAKMIRQLGDEWSSVNFLLTTPRSAKTPFRKDSLPPRCIHQFAPADIPNFIDSFLTYWAPGMAVFAGADVGPATVLCASNHRLPLFLIDANISPKSFQGLKNMVTGQRSLTREFLRRFDHIDVTDAASLAALTNLGIETSRLRISGPLNEVSTALPCNEATRSELAEILIGRPIWLACNVPPDEDKMVLKAHRAASRAAHRLLLILVPDVRARSEELAAKFAKKGVRARLRSLGELPDDETQIYIADTEGENGLWYRLATVNYLGSSTGTANAVQSPLDAAALGSAILHGPNHGAHHANFETLDSEGGARQIQSSQELATGLLNLLAPDQSAAMAHAAWDISTQGAQATDLAIERIETMLEEIGAY